LSERGIAVDNLVKIYPGPVRAVDGISFQVEAGKIFGFLGPNGAGKSTVIKILTTLALPTSGRAAVGGYDVADQAEDVRRIAGVALQEIGIDPLMKPMELLTLQAQLFGASRAQAYQRSQELLKLVKLDRAGDRRAGTYSGGMKRRLDLAMALVHEPRILFLDEPTTGLDPASRRDVWDEVRRLNQKLEITIFLTTQYLEEADELADTVAIIDGGKLAIEGAPDELKAAVGGESINLLFATEQTAQSALSELTGMGDHLKLDREAVRLYIEHAALAIPAVVNRLQQAAIEPVALTITQPTLDDVFLQVTGQRLEVGESSQAQAA
jgi:ABC-2 type transport system ATP-binding protein